MKVMQERRSEVRMLCADMVDVSWKEDGGRSRRTMGLLEDISSSGACMQFEDAVPLGVQIHWQCGKRAFTGTVRYCVYREIGYFAGVEFDSTCRWSKRMYRPQHLLDLQRLVERVSKGVIHRPGR